MLYPGCNRADFFCHGIEVMEEQSQYNVDKNNDISKLKDTDWLSNKKIDLIKVVRILRTDGSEFMFDWNAHDSKKT